MLRACIKQILINLGILGYAKNLRDTAASSLIFIYRFLQFKWVSTNRNKYLRYFDRMYRDKLRVYTNNMDIDRYVGFRLIFEKLLNKKNGDFTIIETGCARNGYWSDGNSSVLFFEFLNIFGGKLISIDIDEKNMSNCCRILYSSIPRTGKARFVPIVGDSANELTKIDEEADLLYLDSFDLEKDNPEPSMRHHFKELESAGNIIKKSKGLILAVDDNWKEYCIAKGKYILEWAKKENLRILLEEYQIVININGLKTQDHEIDSRVGLRWNRHAA